MEKERKYILISGATSGFGWHTAKLFAKNSWDLILTGRREDRLLELKTSIQKDHPECDILTLCFDIQQRDAVIEQVASIPEIVMSKLKILLNNAGLALGRSSIENGDENDWEQMIDTNVKGLLYLSKQIIPVFKRNGGGHIINLGSIAGKEVYPDGNVYCASKFAVDALSKSMRIDLVSYNIKVSNIAPGAANTEFSVVRFKGDQQQADSMYKGFDPLVAEDVAETIYFVASRPAHVNINDIVIMPTAQASTTVFHKK